MASGDGEENCPICLELLEGEALEQTVCGHTYHRQCFEACVENRQTSAFRCPLCRHQLAAPEREGGRDRHAHMALVFGDVPIAMLERDEEHLLSADEEGQLYMARRLLQVPNVPEHGVAAAHRLIDGLIRKQEAVRIFKEWQSRQAERERINPQHAFVRNGVLSYAWLEFEGRSLLSRVRYLTNDEKKEIPISIHTCNRGRMEDTDDEVMITFPSHEEVNKTELAGAINLTPRSSQERVIARATLTGPEVHNDIVLATFSIFPDDQIRLYPSEASTWGSVDRIEVFKMN